MGTLNKKSFFVTYTFERQDPDSIVTVSLDMRDVDAVEFTSKVWYTPQGGVTHYYTKLLVNGTWILVENKEAYDDFLKYRGQFKED